MGAIVDTLLLDGTDIPLLKHQYPDCVLINQSNTDQRIQQYRLIIPCEDQYDDSYYNFLFDNLIATCSRNFLNRFEYDEWFKTRIRARAEASRREMATGIDGP